MRGTLCRFLKPFFCVTSCPPLSLKCSLLHSLELFAVSLFSKTLCLASHSVYRVPWSGKCLLAGSQGSSRGHFVSHCSTSKTTCFICFARFSSWLWWWISLIPVTPFWPEILRERRLTCRAAFAVSLTLCSALCLLQAVCCSRQPPLMFLNIFLCSAYDCNNEVIM